VSEHPEDPTTQGPTPPTLWLTVLAGKHLGSTIPIDVDEFVIGRGEGCQLVVDEPKVSRRHAQLIRRADGRYELRDLNSSNGTFLAGTPVSAPVLLKGDEQLQVGDTVLRASREPPEGPGARTFIPMAVQGRSMIQRVRLERGIRRATVLGVSALAVIVVIALLAATGVLFHKAPGVPAVVAAVAPSTVLIQPQQGGRVAGTGSGWVLDAGHGLVVTDAHVVNGGDNMTVGVGGRLMPAHVVAVAPCEDLAVLGIGPQRGLRALPLGSQGDLRLGQTVVAVGFPGNASLGDDLTSTTGSVSVVRTTFSSPAPDVPRYGDVVQTDTAINPGNSGGPLVDLSGRLVGVNAATRRSAGGRIIQGQNFAIGVDRVKQVVQTLRQGRSIAWTGALLGYPAAAQLARKHWPPGGLLIKGAVSGTPADRAGLASTKAPQLLVGVNGQPLDGTLASYCQAAAGIHAGERWVFSIFDTSTRQVRPLPLSYFGS